MNIYKISNIKIDNNHNPLFELQIIGTPTIFSAGLDELINSLSNNICKQQSYLISLLKIAHKEKNPNLILEISNKYFENNYENITKIGIILAALYISFMIISNFTASKLIEIIGFTTTAGILFFPFTYIFDDIITEIYGFRFSRKTIWIGFLINGLIILGCLLVTYINPSKYWPNQHAFELVFGTSPKILCASMISYFFGEFLNSVILSKMKIMTHGKFFWFRALSSTIIAAIIDTLLFLTIVFYGVMPKEIFLQAIYVQICFKIGYEILLLPITIKIVNFIKRKEQIDTFDHNISYNPFKL